LVVIGLGNWKLITQYKRVPFTKAF
jgi:hypothetical protein